MSLSGWIGGVGFCLLLAHAGSDASGASRHMSLMVTPGISFEPTTLTLVVRVLPRADQRGLRLATDNGRYGRTTEIPLDGLRGPLTSWVEWRDVPAGEYRLVATLMTATDDVAVVHATAIVVSRV